MENDSSTVANEKPETGESAPEAVAEPMAKPVPAPGDILRKARKARGESLIDVVQALKLSHQQLEAIESGRFDALPGPTFVRGFLRNYARHLGLDPEPLLIGLDGQVPKSAHPPLVSNGRANIPVSAPMVKANTNISTNRSAFPVLLILLVLVLAAVGAGFSLGWIEMPQRLTTEAASAEQEGEVFQQVQQELVLPPISLATPAEKQAAEPQDVVAEGLPGAGDISPAAAPAASAAAPPAVAEPEISTLRLTFLSNALVQVREGSRGSGKLLFGGVGNAGSVRNIRGTPPFSLVVGNANRVALEYNGKPVDLKPHIVKDGVARLTLQ
ncbi:MAG: DUF4115 domain-containing protein [Azoarcus sp.]|jgi:cytoskeleton protein RodZ|nr:DUF4115 domain-containing protein [Azoarcus sp.]